jgi:uncharacterized protein (DUF2249 family)
VETQGRENIITSKSFRTTKTRRKKIPLFVRQQRTSTRARYHDSIAGRIGRPPLSSLTKGSPMSDKNVIDVRTIAPPQRHPLIFQTFDKLRPNESLQIVNDHDPAPLHNQFAFRLKGQFTWEYLEQGPETWRVRIAKVVRPAPQPQP